MPLRVARLGRRCAWGRRGRKQLPPTAQRPDRDAQLPSDVGKGTLTGTKQAYRVFLKLAIKSPSEFIGFTDRLTFHPPSPVRKTEETSGHANGYKPKTVASGLGSITFQIPQVRGDTKFYPSALEKGLRSQQALKLALAEMYVQGVSTRKVSAIVEQFCGVSVSSTQVSQCAARLDVHLKAWRERRLGVFAYLALDARYEKVRQDGQLLDCAVLIALGVGPDGKRQILGVSAVLSEAEVHWRAFLQSLQARGLCGVEFIVSDDHAGLRAARAAVFPSVPWQRCQFHLQQNAQAYVPPPGATRSGRRSHPQRIQ